MKRFVKLLFIVCATDLFVVTMTQCRCHHENSTQQIAGSIDRYIQSVNAQWDMAGMAVCFSLNDSVFLAKGYGVKDITQPIDDPANQITPNTRFQVGSVTKSMTALVISTMVDEGLLSWDDTVINILPDFQLYDPWVTQHMQVKDIMTHHTGLPFDYGSYLPSLGYSRHDIYRMLARLKPNETFRGDFQYNNITFLIASQIIEKLTSKTWEQNVKERIFDRMGMNASSMGREGFEAPGDVAVPHIYEWDHGLCKYVLYGEDQALQWLTTIGPGGGVTSTVVDLNRYANVHRTNGMLKGDRLYPAKVFEDVHTGNTIFFQDSSSIVLYGHCWYVEQNNRYRLYYHTGTTYGFECICFFVPECGLSGAIFSNSAYEYYYDARRAIMRRLIDLVQGAPLDRFTDTFRDYATEYYAGWQESCIANDQLSDAADTAAWVAEPEDAASALVGIYHKDDLFGDAHITAQNGKLYITIGPEHYKRELIHQSGLNYVFTCFNHDFPIHFQCRGHDKAHGFIIEFANGEEKDLGWWHR